MSAEDGLFVDGAGRCFRSAEEMWASERSRVPGKDLWLRKGLDYWDTVSPTDDGVLGGYAVVSPEDLKGSKMFVSLLMRRCGKVSQREGGSGGELRAIDIGAGVGRVVKGLLLAFFDHVVVAEPLAHFVEQARVNLAEFGDRCSFHQVEMQACPLQPASYDVIWIQWCLCYLQDDDLVEFLQNCAASLRPGSFICVKENVCIRNITMIVDAEDTSVTRSAVRYRAMFARAGLDVVEEINQVNWPKGLYPVYMWGLAPKAGTHDGTLPP